MDHVSLRLVIVIGQLKSTSSYTVRILSKLFFTAGCMFAAWETLSVGVFLLALLETHQKKSYKAKLE